MSDPWLDHIPSHEREKIRKRLRSPEEYERLRDKVKGPEDLEREMQHNAEFAEARLSLETEKKSQEKARSIVSSFVKEQGIESAFEHVSDKLKEALKMGHFDVTVDHQAHQPRLAVHPTQGPKQGTEAPSGNVAEIFPLKMSLQQQVLSSFTIKKK